MGSESRVCQESLTWSSQQPTCRGERGAFCCLALLWWSFSPLRPPNPPPTSVSPLHYSDHHSSCYLTHWSLLQSCQYLLCNLSSPCPLLFALFCFLGIKHADNIFLYDDTFHMWPMIIFLYVLWSLSRELFECCDMRYSSLLVLWQLADFEITTQRLFDQDVASPTLWLPLLLTHLLPYFLICLHTHAYVIM